MIGVATAGEESRSLGAALCGRPRGAALLAPRGPHARGADAASFPGPEPRPPPVRDRLGISVAAAGEAIGIGPEVGAFLAGFSLASTPYREAIGSRLGVTLRDFLLSSSSSTSAPPRAREVDQLAVAPLPSPPRRRSSSSPRRHEVLQPRLARDGRARADQRVLAHPGALGVRAGDIGDETMTLLTVVALITIAASSYLLLNSRPSPGASRRRWTFLERPVVHLGETGTSPRRRT